MGASTKSLCASHVCTATGRATTRGDRTPPERSSRGRLYRPL
jgi:hypothetical protein